MTYQTTSEQFAATIPAGGLTNTTAPFLTARRGLSQLGKIFSSIGNSLMKAAEASSRVHQIEALHEKSDAELAKMGIKRDEIAQFVFRDLFYT